MRRIFAVQLVIEDTEPVSGFDSGKSFIEEMEETLFEDFPQYKKLSVETKEVWENEAVKELTVYRLVGGN